jgi:hypothetical protein
MKTMPRRGVVYTVAPSYKDINTLWAGTDDGLIQVTTDGGKSWKNVTPSSIPSWSKVSVMDASHFDVNTAYAAVNSIRLDDMRPHIYRTRDGGATWQEIVNGLPNSPINAVKEDPLRKGLLFAGSEIGVSVSFDDGDHWQTLRLNMPATSVRDLVIKDDDLVIGTHGRSFWILDDITPLRQLNASVASSTTIFYKPQATYRVRWSMYPDTPLPPEEPAGQNPPDGAIVNYFLKEKATGVVTLEIFDDKKKLVRRFSSDDKPYVVGEVNIPLYWIRPQQILSGEAGAHRFLWDLHYAPLSVPPSYPISATYQQTAPDPTSPWVMPGTYTVNLTVNGTTYSQPLTVKMDPRVKTSTEELKRQLDLSLAAYTGRQQCLTYLAEIRGYREKIKASLQLTRGTAALLAFDQKLSQWENTPRGSAESSFGRLNDVFASLVGLYQDSDMPITKQGAGGFAEAQRQFEKVMSDWKIWKDANLIQLNKALLKSK